MCAIPHQQRLMKPVSAISICQIHHVKYITFSMSRYIRLVKLVCQALPSNLACHGKYVPSSMSRHARHVKHGTSSTSRQTRHVKHATSSTSRQARHVKHVTSSTSRQARHVKHCHAKRVTSLQSVSNNCITSTLHASFK
jgi:hypothetical protein